MNIPHKTKLVRVGDNEAKIDVALAPLITELWKRNIGTFNCCQENQPGITWIEFATAFDAELFLNIISNQEELYNEIENWNYHSPLLDINNLCDDDGDFISPRNPARFIFSISIRFPKKYIKQILKTIKQTTTNFEKLCQEYL